MKLRITVNPQVVDIELSDEQYQRYLDLKAKVNAGEEPDWQLDDMWDVYVSDISAETEWEVIE